MKITIVVMLGILLLAACGGGGSGSSQTPAPNPGPSNPTLSKPDSQVSNALFSVYADTQAQTGQSVGMVIVANSNIRLTNVVWNQIAGPAVSFLAGNSQAIGFDVEQAGNYQFSVSASSTNGQRLTETIDLSVQQSADIKANIRVDHSVSEQANVSLRIDPSNQSSPTQWQWRQVAGSISVTLNAQDSFVFFDAPDVSQDEIVVIEGSVTLDNGQTISDTSQIVIKNVEINDNGFFPRFSERVVTTDMFAYNQTSPYRDALDSCVYDNQVDGSCFFSTLPLIGSANTQPSIDNILDRVFVSHQWMGDRFKQFLQNSATSADMLKLLRATTAIVISYDVRPSFYWTATGAIYLDAANFWMTPEERDTLNARPDFRSDFGSELSFLIPWRYIKDNDYYFRGSDYPRAERRTKTFEDLEASVSWLMYHELGHANDFFPPTSWSGLSGSSSPLSYANDTEANSSRFATAFPLASQAMQSLAQVSFAGNTASDLQKSYTPEQVSGFFEPDSAPAYYSYSTIREDYATLFERFMMAYRLGVSADVAVIEADEQQTYPVAWGQRNRIAEPKLAARTQYVINQILPEIDAADALNNFPQPQLFTPGLSYFDQLNLGTKQKPSQSRSLSFPSQSWDIQQDLHRHHLGRPEIRN